MSRITPATAKVIETIDNLIFTVVRFLGTSLWLLGRRFLEAAGTIKYRKIICNIPSAKDSELQLTWNPAPKLVHPGKPTNLKMPVIWKCVHLSYWATKAPVIKWNDSSKSSGKRKYFNTILYNYYFKNTIALLAISLARTL